MAGGDPGCWNIWWQPDSCSRLQQQPSLYYNPLDLTVVLGLITVRDAVCWHRILLITGWLLSLYTVTDPSSPASSQVLK